MKLRLPKALLSAMAAAVVAAAPLATTVATGAFFAAPQAMAGDAQINLTDGQEQTSPPAGLTAGGTLTVNVGTEETSAEATWAVQVNTDVTANVTVNSGSTLNINADTSEQYNVFSHSGAKQTITLREGATLKTKRSTSGWVILSNPADTLVDMETDSQWVIESEHEYMSDSIINMSGATITIGSGCQLQTERPNNHDDDSLDTSVRNAITVADDAVKTSVINGDGEILINNTSLFFDVAASTAETFEGTSHLRVDANINGLVRRSDYGTFTGGNLVKKGNGILELTAANTYKGDTVILDGTLLLTGSGNVGGAVSVAEGATLKLGRTGGTITNALTLNGKLDVSGSEFYGGSITMGSTGRIVIEDGASLTLNGAVTGLTAGSIDNIGTIAFGAGATLNGEAIKTAAVTIGTGGSSTSLTTAGVTSSRYGSLSLTDTQKTYFTNSDIPADAAFNAVRFNAGARLIVAENDALALDASQVTASASLESVTVKNGATLTVAGIARDSATVFNVNQWNTEGSGSIQITDYYLGAGNQNSYTRYTSTIAGTMVVSGTTAVKSGSSLEMTGNLTTGRLLVHALNSNTTEAVTIDGGVVNVLSSNKHSGLLSSGEGEANGVIIGHWGNSNGVSSLTLTKGGVLNALDCTTLVAWDSDGLLEIQTSSEANLYGINNCTSKTTMGEVKLSGGRLNLDVGGYEKDSSNNSKMTVSAASTIGTLSTNEISIDEAVTLNAGLTIDTTVRDAQSTGKSQAMQVDGVTQYGTINLAGTTSFSGTGGLTMDGKGTVKINGGGNTATGALTVNDGTTIIGENANWAGNIVVNAGGHLEVQRTTSGMLSDTATITLKGAGFVDNGQYNGALKLANSVNISNDITIGDGGSTVFVAASQTATLSGDISGATLTKGGYGTLNLSGEISTNSLAVLHGGLNISGTLALTNGLSVTDGTLTVENGARFDLTNWISETNAAGDTIYTIVTSGAANVTIGNVWWSVDGGSYDSLTGTYVISAVSNDYYVSDRASFVWGGSSASTFDDSSDVAGSSVTNPVHFSGTSNVTLAENVSSDKVYVEENAVLNLSGAHTLAAGTINLNGSLVIKNGSTNVTGTFFPGENGKIVFDLGTYTDGAITGVVKAENPAMFNNRAFNGDVLIKNGTRIIGNGANISSITVESGAQLGLTGSHTGDVTISGDGTLEVSGVELDYKGALKFNQNLDSGEKLTGNVHIAGGAASISSWYNQKGYINGAIIGGESGSTLTILNGYSSSNNDNQIKADNLQNITTVDVQQGTLSVLENVTNTAGGFTKDGNGVLNITGSLTVKDNSTVAYNAGTMTVNSISGAGTVSVSADKTLTLAGGLTNNAGGLVKQGGGTLSIGGKTQLKSGSVIDIQGGVLVVDNSNTATTDHLLYNYKLDGSGTLEVSMAGGSEWNGDKTKIVANSTFSGLVRVTSGHVTLSSSSLGNGGSWLFDNDVAAQYNGTVSQENNITLIGTSHDIHCNSGSNVTFNADLSGGSFTKKVSGALTFNGTLGLESGFGVDGGTVAFGAGSSVDLSNWAFTRNDDNTYSYTIVSSGAASVTLGTSVNWISGGLAVDGTYNSETGVYTTTAAIGRHVVNADSAFVWGTSNYYAGDSSAADKNAVQFVGDSSVTLAGNITSENSVISTGASVTIGGTANNVTFTNLTNDGKIILANNGRINSASTFVEGKSGTLEIDWGNRLKDGFVNGFTGDVVVKSGAGVLTAEYTDEKPGIHYNTLVVEDGGQYAINGDLTVTGGITITGDGMSGSDKDQRGALKVGGTLTMSGSNSAEAYTSKINADVKIAGGSATICAWNGQGGLINGKIEGLEDNSELLLINSNAGGKNHLIANSMEKISTVEVESGTITLTSARDDDGNADFTNVNGSATQVGDSFTKAGSGKLVLSSISSGAAGTKACTVNVQAGELQICGEMKADTVTLGTGATQSTASATDAAGATFKNVTLSSASLAGATSGTGADIRALGEMTSMTLAAAADISISNVTLYDSTINAGSHSVEYSTTGGSRVMAVASTASTSGQQTRGVVPGPAESGLDGDNNATANSLTATTVQSGGAATGTLTVDVAYSLLDANRGKTLTWTLLDGVDVSGLTLQLGDVLTTLVQNGMPVVTLEVNGTPQDFATVDFKNAGYNLLAGCEGLQHATVILTVENIPEPTTGVLSVLALAALAARRRRK